VDDPRLIDLVGALPDVYEMAARAQTCLVQYPDIFTYYFPCEGLCDNCCQDNRELVRSVFNRVAPSTVSTWMPISSTHMTDR